MTSECMSCKYWSVNNEDVFLDGECSNELAKMSVETNGQKKTNKLKTNHHFSCPYFEEK